MFNRTEGLAKPIQTEVTLIGTMKFNASESSSFPDINKKNIQEII